MQSINSKRDKLVISALCIWSFLHSYLIIRSHQFEYLEDHGLKYIHGKRFSPSSEFYPFTNNLESYWFDVRYYDFTEYFVYVVGAWFIFFLFRFLKK